MTRKRSTAQKRAASQQRTPAKGAPAPRQAAPPQPSAAVRQPAAEAADEKTYRGLRIFNLVMGFLHLLQGVLMIVLSNDTTYPIYTSYLTFDVAARTLRPNTLLSYELPFGIAVAVFLLLSAAAHFSLATFAYGWYKRSLARHMNPARFYEYALSSSLMIVLIGMLVGIWDAGTMIVMFGVNAMMNLFGILMELHNQTTAKTDWTSFIYGCIAGVIPWVIICLYFFNALSSAGAKPPAFVYAIIPTIFVFFNCFAVNMFLQYKKVGPWKDYLFGERMYIVLSLAAKTALAWMIFAGTLAPV